MDDLFLEFLKRSNNLRPGYQDSLGKADQDLGMKYFNFSDLIPALVNVIYSKVNGTPYNIENQKLMDFIPGYLLISSNEYKKNYDDLNNSLSEEFEFKLFPILRNYSSDFITVHVETNEVFHVFHDDDPYIIHENPQAFLETLNLYYDENVFFPNADGYLDYDIDKQYQVAFKHNPSIEFWNE